MIREFIVDHIVKKLDVCQSIVIYDENQRYAELLPLLQKKAKVADVRESVLVAREEAYAYFNNELPADDKKRLIVYSPFSVPNTEQEKTDDPFFIFTLGHSYFPSGAADRYEALCHACFPDK